jgi:hypothetical protein
MLEHVRLAVFIGAMASGTVCIVLLVSGSSIVPIRYWYLVTFVLGLTLWFMPRRRTPRCHRREVDDG